MSELIDLDLVELRCRLRGWTCTRRPDEVVCRTPAGYAFVSQLGWQTWEHHTYQYQREITCPRWTLDRLLSDPPDGWTCGGHRALQDLTSLGRLVWGEVIDGTTKHEIEAHVCSWQGSLGLGLECHGDAGPDELARYAQRLKAAAELALILAEVEP